MTPRVMSMGTEYEQLDRALALVMEAADALHAAVASDDDDGLELTMALGEVRGVGYALMDAGAALAADRVPSSPTETVTAAARSAHALLRRAADELPRGGNVTDAEFRALADLWVSIRALRGWL